MRRSAPQRLVQIQFVCSGVSNEHRYSCTIMVISSEEMRINVQLFIINVQEWAITVQEWVITVHLCTKKGYFFGKHTKIGAKQPQKPPKQPYLSTLFLYIYWV